jgi:hypothetical protein
MMYSDTITTLKSAGRRLTKLVKVDGEIVGYDEARTFTPDELDVASIGDLYEVLSEISADPYRCVVRGALVNCGATTPIRRLIHVDKDTGDRATLYEVPRFWVATDWDTLPRPDSVDLTDLAACASVALARLPVEFRGVSHIVSATSSHGIKDGIRIRLWHWLSRPLVLADLKIWLGGV